VSSRLGDWRSRPANALGTEFGAAQASRLLVGKHRRRRILAIECISQSEVEVLL
jgi:hypothetical protein